MCGRRGENSAVDVDIAAACFRRTHGGDIQAGSGKETA